MRQPIEDESTWLGPDIQNSDRWRHQLSVEDVEEIAAALGTAKDAGASIENLSKETFPLRGFAGRINVMLDELEDGLGLYLFRGFPALDYSKEDLRLIYWGIGLYCGQSVSQSKRGDVLGDVRDIGTPLDGPEFRGYTSNGELTYHSDAADVTALFCLRAAKQGGLSRIVSLSYVHNEILRTRPDLLEVA